MGALSKTETGGDGRGKREDDLVTDPWSAASALLWPGQPGDSCQATCSERGGGAAASTFSGATFVSVRVGLGRSAGSRGPPVQFQRLQNPHYMAATTSPPHLPPLERLRLSASPAGDRKHRLYSSEPHSPRKHRLYSYEPHSPRPLYVCVCGGEGGLWEDIL